MSKISVQQRKYFVERIEKSINEKISELRQTNAAEVQNISEKEFRSYLKQLKIEKEFDRYKELYLELTPLGTKLSAIYDELRSVFTKNSWDSNVPSLYGGYSDIDLDKAIRWCCHQTAKKHESETDAGKMIKELEGRIRAAIDELHGINELEGLKVTVNNILKGANVPLLGQ